MSIVWSEPGIFNVLDPWYYDPVSMSYVGMTPGPGANPALNTAVLQAIINIAQTTDCSNANPYGATILFPGHSAVPAQGSDGHDEGATYLLYAPAIAIDCNWPLKFVGTGNVKLLMVIDDPEVPVSGDMFQVDTGNGHDNSGGITFEDLTFQYPPISETSGIPQWAAIHATGGTQNVRIVHCVFTDCPIGIWFEKVLQCNIVDCFLQLSQNFGIGVILGDTISGNLAKEIFITDCLFEVGGNAPPGSTALQIYGTDQVFVNDCHFDSFTYGIQIIPGPTGANAVHLHFNSCTVYTGATSSGAPGGCCIIQPQPSGGEPGTAAVAQVVFTSCFFEPGETPGFSASGPGILIDASYGSINTVRFVSCYSTRWPGPGLKITGVTSEPHLLPAQIEVLGGMYAGNNFGGGGATDAYGIHVAAAAGVRISGASCVGDYYYIISGSTGSSPTQDVGIYVDSNASDVIVTGCDCRENNEEGIVVNAASDVVISGCDLSNNGAQGVLVNAGSSSVIIDACDVTNNTTNGIKVVATSGAVTGVYIRNCNASGYSSYNVAIYVDATGTYASTVEITNCAGYNDTGQSLGSLVSMSTPFYNRTYGYYGPVTFFVATNTIVTAIKIGGNATGLKTGTFLLQPGVAGEIDWSGIAAPGFTIIGQ